MSDLPVVGVVRETAAGEERVALDPEVTAKLVASGFDVLVEPGAGRASWFRDQDYASSGAQLVARGALLERAQVVLCHQPVPSGELHRGQALVGMLQPLVDPAAASAYAEAGVDTVSLDGLPRTLSAAQRGGDQTLDGPRLRRHRQPTVHRPEDRQVLQRRQVGAGRPQRRGLGAGGLTTDRLTSTRHDVRAAGRSSG